MASILRGRHYVRRGLLLVTGGVFTLTVHRVSPGHRSGVLQRFGLRTRDGWRAVRDGVMEARIMCAGRRRDRR